MGYVDRIFDSSMIHSIFLDGFYSYDTERNIESTKPSGKISYKFESIRVYRECFHCINRKRVKSSYSVVSFLKILSSLEPSSMSNFLSTFIVL